MTMLSRRAFALAAPALSLAAAATLPAGSALAAPPAAANAMPPLAQMSIGRFKVTAPVSYTHLDVDKRQPQ